MSARSETRCGTRLGEHRVYSVRDCVGWFSRQRLCQNAETAESETRKNRTQAFLTGRRSFRLLFKLYRITVQVIGAGFPYRGQIVGRPITYDDVFVRYI